MNLCHLHHLGKLNGWDSMTQEERQEELEKLEFLNTDGTAVGYLVDGYLVGNVVEAGEDYIAFEWWMPVDSYESTDLNITTYRDGAWYNPTAKELQDAEIRRMRGKI